MLWICLHLPHLAVELRSSDDDFPLAVTEGTGSRRRVIACNRHARESGIAAGMDAPSSLMREPALQLFDRSKGDERRALNAIAGWAQQFTGDVCLDTARWLVWLEVGASLRYFRGLSAVHERIREGIAALGYTASIGIAPTLEASALLTRHPDLMPVINRSDLRRMLAALPLSGLDIGARVIDHLHTAGLRTLTDLLAVPEDSLARRFGEELPEFLRRLLGESADVRPRYRAPPTYRRRFELDGVETVEGLLFPLRRMLQELEGYLRGRDVAVQQLAVSLRHRGEARTLLQLVTSAPERNALRLFALLREKLERTRLEEPVTAIEMAADEFVEPRILQGDFFDDHQRENESWLALLDKLRARLGADAVRRLGLSDDHRPENAWCVLTDGKGIATEQELPDRPLWFLPEPRPIGQLPQLLGTPERIEAGWWSGTDVSRDYYLARTDSGARWWLFREAGTDRWYLQGLWA